jgi:small-conductance mechanosensitive channel
MFTSIATGLRAAVRQPKLVAFLWALYFLLSLVPALPALAFLRAGLDLSPAASEALRRFDFGLVGDLTNYDSSRMSSVLIMTALGTLLVALVASAFAMGGILEVLGGESGDGDRRTFMHRFARGGGHFFWRFIRLAAAAAACAGLAAALVASLAGAVLKPLGESEWEPGGYLAGVILVACVAGTAALFLLALDYARIRVARDDSRKMLRAYVGALGFVVRHVVSAYGIALGIVALLAGVMLLYVAYETMSPVASTGALVALLFVLQQITVAARVFLRVALIGAEQSYYGRAMPMSTFDAEYAAQPSESAPAAGLTGDTNGDG